MVVPADTLVGSELRVNPKENTNGEEESHQEKGDP